MKIAYLLESYDAILRQIYNQSIISNKEIINELSKFESESLRIYKVVVTNRQGIESVKISKPFHSFHPKVKPLELKTIFNFNDFENYIPILKKHIDFTGETILFAADPERLDTFYVCEKCTISELNPKERFFLYCHQRGKQENINIKSAIKEKVFKLKSHLKIEHFIHKNQLAMESLLNKLSKQINPETTNELYQFSIEYDKIDCLKAIYANLEKLLVFIESEYNEYLNVNIKVPQRTVLMNDYSIKPKLDFVRDSLLAKEMNQDLLKILFEPIVVLSTINIQNQITYYQFNYATEYIFELTQLLHEKPNQVNDSEIEEWLLDLNMNSFKYFDFKTNKLKEELNKCDSDFEKLEKLYENLKRYNQHRSKINKSFIDKLPPMKDQICFWIEEEIDFINIKKNIGNQQFSTSKTAEPTNKILIGLSVAQISYFVNILMKTGIIKHSNQRDVFRMIADNFKTKGTDNISVDSLSSKFYNVETSTRNTIKEKIIELLNLTKQ